MQNKENANGTPDAFRVLFATGWPPYLCKVKSAIKSSEKCREKAGNQNQMNKPIDESPNNQPCIFFAPMAAAKSTNDYQSSFPD